MNDAFRALSDTESTVEARRLLDTAFPEKAPLAPTSYRDTTPVPKIGDTPPVPQPDHRIVPPWAAGIAVASIGVGAGVTGAGCGAWLVLQGLSSITLMGVLAGTLPFAGLAAVITAAGMAISRARAVISTTHHHYEGDVTQNIENHTTANTRGMFARTVNEQPHN